jgi:hypothetical protein
VLTVIQIKLDIFSSYKPFKEGLSPTYCLDHAERSICVVKLHSQYGTSITAVNVMMPIIRQSCLHVRLGIIHERKHITKKVGIRNALHEMLICSYLLLSITKFVVLSYYTYFSQSQWEVVI